MSDISTYYGGSIVALVGKDCVSIACDKRLGSGLITVSKNFTRIFQITEKIYIGLPTFLPDCQYLLKKIKKNVSLFKLDEGREIEPKELANLISYLLYSARASPWYTNPIVVGLDSSNKPYVCGMDCLGCKTESGSFVAGGTAETNIMGMCEILFKDNMEEDDLFTVTMQAFLNAIDRNGLSGWGAECVILTKDKKIVRRVQGRCD